jgi:hypothetical protein
MPWLCPDASSLSHEELVVRILKSPALWLLLIALTIVVVANWNDDPSGRSHAVAGEHNPAAVDSKDRKVETNKSDSLVREGTELNNLRGRIKVSPNSGRSMVYEEQSKRSLICLENLWLQRVIAAQKNEDQSIIWSLTGKVTEYEGQNYFLILQATKSN